MKILRETHIFSYKHIYSANITYVSKLTRSRGRPYFTIESYIPDNKTPTTLNQHMGGQIMSRTVKHVYRGAQKSPSKIKPESVFLVWRRIGVTENSNWWDHSSLQANPMIFGANQWEGEAVFVTKDIFKVKRWGENIVKPYTHMKNNYICFHHNARIPFKNPLMHMVEHV